MVLLYLRAHGWVILIQNMFQVFIIVVLATDLGYLWRELLVASSLNYSVSSSISDPILSCFLLWALTQAWSGGKVLNLDHLLLLALVWIVLIVVRHRFMRAQIFRILVHWSNCSSSSLVWRYVFARVSRARRSNFLYVLGGITIIGSTSTPDTTCTSICISWSESTLVVTVILDIIYLSWVLLNRLLFLS